MINNEGEDEEIVTYDNSLQCFTDFNADDQIYEERATSDPLHIKKFAVKCILTIITITVVGGFVAAVVSIPFIYFDLNFMNLCDSTKWNELPSKIRLAHLFSHCFADQVFMFWCIIPYCLAFRIDGNKLHLSILYCLIVGCIGTIYRLSTFIFQIYGTSSWLGTPQYSILLLTIFISPCIILSNQRLNRREKFKFYCVLVSQHLVVFVNNYLNLFVILPLFLKINPPFKSLMAIFVPMIGFVSRIICRRSLSSSKTCFHPGNIYILNSVVYAVTILFYRILQASVTSLNSFMLLSSIHAIVTFLERLFSTLYSKRITAFLCRKILRREISSHRNLKEKRVMADCFIAGIIYEIWAIVVTNCVHFLYSVQHKIPHKHDSMYHFLDQFGDTLIRLSYSLCVESIFVYFAVVILTVKVNMPINRIWCNQWKRITLVLIINAVFAILLTTKTIANITEKSYSESLSNRGDNELANKLFMCNYTYYPY